MREAREAAVGRGGGHMGLTRGARRAASIARLRAESTHAESLPRGPVFVHIGDLVLHGFPPSARRRIADGLEGELARLFAAAGVSPALAGAAASPRLDAGSVRVRPGAPGRT